ncbi:unnamed protein product [Aphanomyces euteiches]|uniref:Uncharacterized protein n=1 Tax=Aphanomyces euteiches TaxID=100861 RepID=A0A6G0WT50_9STRA|nr:hypothetical protein Ae201684_012026 [Aphanomyces euteiches]KAH9056018.1 hypothetical protein Ae201684P_021758 [Aphanomyces euteiches]KAH9155414.1 hypothetical protein AeRB84_002615 [Aphanomyces euteiches]
MENSVNLRLLPTTPSATPVDGTEKITTRKRNVQHVATHEDKLRVMTWMLAEEQALMEDGYDHNNQVHGDGSAVLKKSDKVVGKSERMCLATRAIAQFPELFRGTAQANYMKASRWWKESKEYIYETSGMSATKKARSGRGRKTNAWTSWLQTELKNMIELEPNATWNNKDLLAMAKSILENSIHPEFNKDFIVPHRNCPLSDLINLRWVQVFKEKFHVNAAARPSELSEIKEAELLHHLATIRDTKGGPIGKKDVLMVANQLLRETQPTLKMDPSWYKGFCDRHPDLNLTPLPTSVTSSTRDFPTRPAAPRIIKSDVSVVALPIDEVKVGELFQAINHGHFNVVKSLLIQGVSPEGCDDTGCTALLVATQGCQFNMVKVLLEFGAKTEARDQNGLTPLVIAATSSQFHVAKSLLESQANIEATNEQCKTPLMLAAERGDLKLVKLFLRMGANIEARDEDDNTAVLLAAKNQHDRVVEFLVKKGATVHVQDVDGVSLAELTKASKQTTLPESLDTTNVLV